MVDTPLSITRRLLFQIYRLSFISLVLSWKFRCWWPTNWVCTLKPLPQVLVFFLLFLPFYWTAFLGLWHSPITISPPIRNFCQPWLTALLRQWGQTAFPMKCFVISLSAPVSICWIFITIFGMRHQSPRTRLRQSFFPFENSVLRGLSLRIFAPLSWWVLSENFLNKWVNLHSYYSIHIWVSVNGVSYSIVLTNQTYMCHLQPEASFFMETLSNFVKL